MAAILRVRDNDGNITDIPAIKGDKGDKGEPGIQGIKGDKGDPGERGEKGDPVEPYVIGDTLVFEASSPDTVYRVEKTSDDTENELLPNVFYVFPEMTSLSVTFAAPSDTTVVNEYKFRFTSGTTATTLTLPASVIGELTVEANKVYEISIIDNYLVYQSWAVSA